MLKLGVLVSGGGTNLQAIIDAIDSGVIRNATIAIVVSSRKDAYALERCAAHGILSTVLRQRDFESQDEYENAMIDVMKSHGVGLVVTAGFMSILHPSFIAAFPNKIINVHPSLIPSFCGKGWYGIKVHQGVLAAGVRVTGATVHYVNEVVDGGKIIDQKAVEVVEGDTAESLQKRVLEQCEWVILPRAINQIANKEQEV